MIPESLVSDLLKWYHLVLGHCGSQRLYDTVKARFFAKNLNKHCISTVNSCEVCRMNKSSTKQYGLLPPRVAGVFPWRTVAVDLIGPWKIKINGRVLEFNALTCIDPVTNLTEISRIRNKTSKHIADQFANCWLSRYPRPIECIHNNGGEFIGHEFRALLNQAGIKSKATTVKNPQANSVCERMHKTVADILRTLTKEKPPKDAEEACKYIDNSIGSCIHALRCDVNSVTNHM